MELIILLAAIQTANGEANQNTVRALERREKTQEYYTLKPQKWNKSLKRAVACFTYSWSGKEWGGYVGHSTLQETME